MVGAREGVPHGDDVRRGERGYERQRTGRTGKGTEDVVVQDGRTQIGEVDRDGVDRVQHGIALQGGRAGAVAGPSGGDEPVGSYGIVVAHGKERGVADADVAVLRKAEDAVVDPD